MESSPPIKLGAKYGGRLFIAALGNFQQVSGLLRETDVAHCMEILDSFSAESV
jgi:hypothetical protein